MFQFVETYFYLFRIKGMISKFKRPSKTFDRIIIVRIKIFIFLVEHSNHEHLLISNCPDLLNIRSRATAFIIRLNVLGGHSNLDIMSCIPNRLKYE